MMAFEKQDNASFDHKVSLRQTALEFIELPIIMETHAGIGDIFQVVYHQYKIGVAFDKNPMKCEILARQRPTWAVYQADSQVALSLGAGSHLEVNFLDVDPYGDSWPTIKAFFGSQRTFTDRMVLVVNDGLRKKVQIGGSWNSKTLRPVARVMGNDLWHRYLDACKLLLSNTIKDTGYRMSKFDGYYTGEGKRMTHFMALLER